MNTTTDLMKLPAVERAALALESAQHENKLRELATAYADITEVHNKAGRDQVHAAAMVLKNTRVAIEKTGKAARDDANEYSKAVIQEQGRLTNIISGEEARLFALRDSWDDEQERIRRAAEEAERARVAEIRSRIAHLRDIPLRAYGKSSVEIGQILAETVLVQPSDELYAEYKLEAGGVVLESVQRLQAMLDEQKAKEMAEAEAQIRADMERRERAAEAERQRAAAAELARQQADLARQRAALEEQQRAIAAKAQADADEAARLRAELQAKLEEANKATEPEPEPAPAPAPDTRPVITVELEPAPEFPILEDKPAPTLRLGQINERLAPLSINADGLLRLGFAHSGTDKAAKLYHVEEFKAICAAISRHVLAISRQYEQ